MASPMWWAVGWVLSILLLFAGFAIGEVYYETEADERKRNRGAA